MRDAKFVGLNPGQDEDRDVAARAIHDKLKVPKKMII